MFTLGQRVKVPYDDKQRWGVIVACSKTSPPFYSVEFDDGKVQTPYYDYELMPEPTTYLVQLCEGA